MYSSIYRVQSSTRRLPIRALFGFTLKLVESYLSFPSESLCGGLSLVPTLGRLTTVPSQRVQEKGATQNVKRGVSSPLVLVNGSSPPLALGNLESPAEESEVFPVEL